jgi:hypothetical protein
MAPEPAKKTTAKKTPAKKAAETAVKKQGTKKAQPAAKKATPKAAPAKPKATTTKNETKDVSRLIVPEVKLQANYEYVLATRKRPWYLFFIPRSKKK